MKALTTKTKNGNALVVLNAVLEGNAKDRARVLAYYEAFQEKLEKIRVSLDYVARNMHESFDGALGGAESNAYASLCGVRGLLLDLEDDVTHLCPFEWREEDRKEKERQK